MNTPAETGLTPDRPSGGLPGSGLQRVSIGLILAATFVVYIGTLTFGFVYDDHRQIVANPLLRSWKFFTYYFRHDVWSQQSVAEVSNYYRPVFLIWLRINEALFGVAALGWHMAAVMLHLLATWLVYRLCVRLLRNHWQSCLAAGLFGLDPIHLEAAAWISGASETLMAVLLLGSFLFYLKGRDNGPRRSYWLAASVSLFLGATLAKETALILPFLILAHAWLFAGAPGSKGLDRAKHAGAISLLYFLTAALYLVVRVKVLGAIGHTITRMPWTVLFYTWPSVLWLYVRLLVWPTDLSAFYDAPYVSHPGILNFYAPLAGLIAIAAGLAWWSLRSRVAAFAALWLVLPILPVMDFRVFGPGDIAHTRYLYLPSIGFVILTALLISRFKVGHIVWFGRPAAQILIAGAILGAFAIGTVWQSAFWANDIVLCYRGMKVAPKSPDARDLLGVAMMRRREWGRAIALFEEAIALQPQYIVAYSNLALVYSETGQYSQSTVFAKQAIAMDPYGGEAWLVLGVDALELGRPNEAVSDLRRAAELAPHAYRVHYALGIALRKTGALQEALEEFQSEPADSPKGEAARQQAAAVELLIAAGENGQKETGGVTGSGRPALEP